MNTPRLALLTILTAIFPNPNVGSGTSNLLADQACFFDGVARFEILSARRISTSFRVQYTGHEGELWEVWEFEFFTHSEAL